MKICSMSKDTIHIWLQFLPRDFLLYALAFSMTYAFSHSVVNRPVCGPPVVLALKNVVHLLTPRQQTRE